MRSDLWNVHNMGVMYFGALYHHPADEHCGDFTTTEWENALVCGLRCCPSCIDNHECGLDMEKLRPIWKKKKLKREKLRSTWKKKLERCCSYKQSTAV